MMLSAEKWGLLFDSDAVQVAFEDSNVHSRMYNSRDGFAVYRDPYLFLGAMILVRFYWWVRRRCQFNKTVDACERLRHLVISENVENNEPLNF